MAEFGVFVYCQICRRVVDADQADQEYPDGPFTCVSCVNVSVPDASMEQAPDTLTDQ